MTQDANEAAILAEPVARLNARIPEDLHTRLGIAAKEQRTTIQALLIEALTGFLARQEATR